MLRVVADRVTTAACWIYFAQMAYNSFPPGGAGLSEEFNRTDYSNTGTWTLEDAAGNAFSGTGIWEEYRIGNFAVGSGRINWFNKGSASGGIRLVGMPALVTPSSQPAPAQIDMVQSGSVTVTHFLRVTYPVGPTDYGVFYDGTQGGTPLTDAVFPAAGFISFTYYRYGVLQ